MASASTGLPHTSATTLGGASGNRCGISQWTSSHAGQVMCRTGSSLRGTSMIWPRSHGVGKPPEWVRPTCHDSPSSASMMCPCSPNEFGLLLIEATLNDLCGVIVDPAFLAAILPVEGCANHLPGNVRGLWAERLPPDVSRPQLCESRFDGSPVELPVGGLWTKWESPRAHTPSANRSTPSLSRLGMIGRLR